MQGANQQSLEDYLGAPPPPSAQPQASSAPAGSDLEAYLGAPSAQVMQQAQTQPGIQYPNATPLDKAINQAVPAVQNIPVVGNTIADMLRGAQATNFMGPSIPMSLMQGVTQGAQSLYSGAVNLRNKLFGGIQTPDQVNNPQSLQNPISPATAFVGNIASSALLPEAKIADAASTAIPLASKVAPIVNTAATGAGYGALYGNANGNTAGVGQIAASALAPVAMRGAIAGAGQALNGNAIKAAARPAVSQLMGMFQNRGLNPGSPLLNPVNASARDAAIGNLPVSIGEFIKSPGLTGTYNNMAQVPFSGQMPVLENKLAQVGGNANDLMNDLLGKTDPASINPAILNELQQNADDIQSQASAKYDLASQIAQQSNLDTTATPTAQAIAKQALAEAALARQKNQVHWLNGSGSGLNLVKKIAAGPTPTTILNKSALPEDLAQYQDMPNVSIQQTGNKILSTSASPEDLSQYNNLKNVSIVPIGSKTIADNVSSQDLAQYQSLPNVSIVQKTMPPSFGIGPQTPRYTVTQPLHTVSQPTFTVTKAIPSNLNDSIQTRSAIGEQLAQARINGENAKATLFGNIYSGMTQDLNNNIAATNNPTLQAAWQDANNFYRDQVVPYQSPSIRQLLTKPDTTDLTSPLMRPENATVLANLSQKSKNLVAYQELNKSLGMSDGQIEPVPSKLAGNYARLAAQYPGALNRLLPPETQQNFSNFHTQYNATKTAGPIVNPPPTGVQVKSMISKGIPSAIGLGGLGAAFFHPLIGAAAVTSPIAALGLNRGAAKLMTSPLLRQAYGSVTRDASGNVIPDAVARRQFVNKALPYKPTGKTVNLLKQGANAPVISNLMNQIYGSNQ